jgi:hypothetical protein
MTDPMLPEDQPSEQFTWWMALGTYLLSILSALASDLYPEYPTFRVIVALIAGISLIIAVVLTERGYRFLFPKPPAPIPAELIAEKKVCDDLSAYSTRNKDGVPATVVVHISFEGTLSPKDEPRILVWTQLAVQRAINEHYLSHDTITYSELDDSIDSGVSGFLTNDSDIDHFHVSTVEIK